MQHFLTDRSKFVRILFAGAALVLGLVVYLLYRSPESVYLLPVGLFPESSSASLPGFEVLSRYAPSFLHVYAFILLTAIVLVMSHVTALIISAAWLCLELVLEIGQSESVSTVIVSWLPMWFRDYPFLENIGPYFSLGTFDSGDMLAIVCGSVAAYLTLRLTENREHSHVMPEA